MKRFTNKKGHTEPISHTYTYDVTLSVKDWTGKTVKNIPLTGVFAHDDVKSVSDMDTAYILLSYLLKTQKFDEQRKRFDGV